MEVVDFGMRIDTKGSSRITQLNTIVARAQVLLYFIILDIGNVTMDCSVGDKIGFTSEEIAQLDRVMLHIFGKAVSVYGQFLAYVEGMGA